MEEPNDIILNGKKLSAFDATLHIKHCLSFLSSVNGWEADYVSSEKSDANPSFNTWVDLEKVANGKNHIMRYYAIWHNGELTYVAFDLTAAEISEYDYTDGGYKFAGKCGYQEYLDRITPPADPSELKPEQVIRLEDDLDAIDVQSEEKTADGGDNAPKGD